MRGADQLKTIVRETPWLMEALLAGRKVSSPDWLIGAGALRTAVWDQLHEFSDPTPLADIDLVLRSERSLPRARAPGRGGFACRAARSALGGDQPSVRACLVPRKVRYEVKPFRTTAEAVATWPETATSVGLRLEEDDDLVIVAPLDLDDLLGLVHRINPARFSIEEYERRLTTKRIAERWPRATIMPAS
jgi:uncharacterized protein